MTLLKIVVLTGAIILFFRTKIGAKVSKFFPIPFWIYFLSILAGTVGFLPRESPVYGWITLYVLTASLFLMLIGSPVTDLIRMGPRALLAISLAVGGMVSAGLIVYVFFARWLPEGSWRAVGALLGTWVGGSANMLAVKEILQLPDAGYAPLIIVDAVMSYSWMALLVAGAAYQDRFDKKVNALEIEESDSGSSMDQDATRMSRGVKIAGATVAILIAAVFSALLVELAKFLFPKLPILTTTAWALLLTSIAAILLALTPLRRLEKVNASAIGQHTLFTVLVSIGAKTSFNAALQAPIFMIFGAFMLLIHGAVMVWGGKIFRLPLFLLATASQAIVGGAISAPIVAAVYRAKQAHFGVLMAIFGALTGTYVGVAGGLICRWLDKFVR